MIDLKTILFFKSQLTFRIEVKTVSSLQGECLKRENGIFLVKFEEYSHSLSMNAFVHDIEAHKILNDAEKDLSLKKKLRSNLKSYRWQLMFSEKQVSDKKIMDLTYEVRCQSDSMRLLRHSKVFGFTFQPITEKQVSLLLSDSRVIILDVMATKYARPQVKNIF